MMKPQIVLKEFVKGVAVTLVVFAAFEILLRIAYFARNSMVTYIPLVYDVSDEYGPAPPWLDSFRILEKDETLIWKNRPNIRRRYLDVFSPVNTEDERAALRNQFFPRIPDSLKRNPAWAISLNSEGFRDVEFPKVKSASTFRIICLGDSWTFGANVDQNKAYPQQLGNLLNRNFPQTNFEVFNFGVMGYSSYQGLQLLRRKVLALHPDLVMIGFAMNDSSVAGYRDKELGTHPGDLGNKIGRVLEGIESFKLLRYLALALRDKPKSLRERLKAEVDSVEKGEDTLGRKTFARRDYDKIEPWTRVSLTDYEKNILEMITLARSHRADVILLFNDLWTENPYRAVLKKISQAERVPVVDSSALVAKERRRTEKDLEKKLALRSIPASRHRPDPGVEVVFRVYTDNRVVPKAVYIVGNHPKLGKLVPNKIAMYDDGTHGDQRAGDHVWSYSVTLPVGTKLFYVYTNSGEEGQWEGLDVPTIRAFEVEAQNNQGRIYQPIESFGKLYMQADNWHTNADGYAIIAKASLKVLQRQKKVRNYLRKVSDNRSRGLLS